MCSCRQLAGVGAVFAIAQVIEDYVLTPRIIGGKLEWRPMLAFIALIIAGDLFGLLGLVLAIPVLAVIKVLIRFLDELYLRSDFFLAPATPDGETTAAQRAVALRGSLRLRSDERGSLIGNLLVPEKNRTFLNMPRAGGNGHEG
jgi:hypothetical protein